MKVHTKIVTEVLSVVDRVIETNEELIIEEHFNDMDEYVSYEVSFHDTAGNYHHLTMGEILKITN